MITGNIRSSRGSGVFCLHSLLQPIQRLRIWMKYDSSWRWHFPAHDTGEIGLPFVAGWNGGNPVRMSWPGWIRQRRNARLSRSCQCASLCRWCTDLRKWVFGSIALAWSVSGRFSDCRSFRCFPGWSCSIWMLHELLAWWSLRCRWLANRRSGSEMSRLPAVLRRWGCCFRLSLRSCAGSCSERWTWSGWPSRRSYPCSSCLPEKDDGRNALECFVWVFPSCLWYRFRPRTVRRLFCICRPARLPSS